MKKRPSFLSAFLPLMIACAGIGMAADDHLVFPAKSDGPGRGKHVVLLSGDEEYRSEEALPMLGQLLARHGFKATVLFSLNSDGTVNPDNGGSLAHSEALDSADAIVMSLRFRHWDDASMERFERALNRGVPIVALRTSTHAFNFKGDSKWAKYSYNARADTGWEKGFGRQVLGETWVNHHGRHKKEACRTHVEKGAEDHPVLRGVGEIFCTSDVYGANPLQPSTILLRGEVTESFDPESKGVDAKNDPMQPVAWVREFDNAGERNNRILTTTMGAASDLVDPDLRRLVVNGVFWGLGLDVPAKADVEVKDFEPSFYSFKAYKVGLEPKDFIPGAPAFKEAPAMNEKKKAEPRKKAGPKKKAEKKKQPKSAAAKKMPEGVEAPKEAASVAFSAKAAPGKLEVRPGDNIVLIGAGMGSRMVHFGHFETEVFLRFPDRDITIRNLCDEGNTPGFRPHPGRNQDDQYAFPGARELLPKALQAPSKPAGHFETPDQWLTRLEADTIVAFFGFNSSFGGLEDLSRFKTELEAFVRHTLSRKYNGESVPQLALVSPTAFQDLSDRYSVPDGTEENKNLELYTNAMRDVARVNGALFIDAFQPSLGWYEKDKDTEFTRDGALLSDEGYRRLAPVLADGLFGESASDASRRESVHAAVMEKNWMWLNDFKIPNGVHVYGRRYNPYGPGNYPFELKKTREMTAIRDRAIWATLKGESFDVAAEDARTSKLPPVETNYKPSAKNGTVDYRPGEVVETKIKVPEGYQIDLFADETMFPDLANPVQLAFDNKGRLWVSTMASYPHYRIGDPKPQDKLIIFEDTDGDGKADKQTNFADDLHIPIGFEISHDGVYVSQSGSLILLKDEDGDDRYDTREVVMSGFDDHDTHHAISAFCADPSGAFIMGEGVFLHSNVESAYGPVRGTNGGFFRYSPQRRQVLRHAQFSIPNPWGVAYDDYGQDFFLHTSGTSLSWMTPGMVYARYGANMKAPDIITSNKVRPTSGLEIISSRHFPDEAQGDILLNNAIGFLGAKQHRLIEDGTGFTTEYVQDLFVSEDPNFRPVDLEFAPDGSLYVVDWHNALIGHMQHSARDPHRDHSHGRIYRVTYPSRPLVEPARIDGASIAELLENLKLHEYRSRYRTRRELRMRDAGEVAAAASKWAAQQKDDRLKLEALWVTWGADRIDAELLSQLLGSEDHRVRAAAVRVARYNDHKLANLSEILLTAANDDHGRVRLEAITAASYLPEDVGRGVLTIAKGKGLDSYMEQSYQFAENVFTGAEVKAEGSIRVRPPAHLSGQDGKLYSHGAEIYSREGHCGTCHQSNGMGLPDAGFPPLAGTEWAVGDPDRLIKLSLNGLLGPIEVQGKTYPGLVPMTAFGAILNDNELAAVLTYVRNSFGNKASPIHPDQVKKVREATKGKIGMYQPSELLEMHPIK